jgi:hypothetical protein
VVLGPPADIAVNGSPRDVLPDVMGLSGFGMAPRLTRGRGGDLIEIAPWNILGKPFVEAGHEEVQARILDLLPLQVGGGLGDAGLDGYPVIYPSGQDGRRRIRAEPPPRFG